MIERSGIEGDLLFSWLGHSGLLLTANYWIECCRRCEHYNEMGISFPSFAMPVLVCFNLLERRLV